MVRRACLSPSLKTHLSNTSTIRFPPPFKARQCRLDRLINWNPRQRLAEHWRIRLVVSVRGRSQRRPTPPSCSSTSGANALWDRGRTSRSCPSLVAPLPLRLPGRLRIDPGLTHQRAARTPLGAPPPTSRAVSGDRRPGAAWQLVLDVRDPLILVALVVGKTSSSAAYSRSPPSPIASEGPVSPGHEDPREGPASSPCSPSRPDPTPGAASFSSSRAPSIVKSAVPSPSVLTPSQPPSAQI